jgi:miniconductance mechanosensitive channel
MEAMRKLIMSWMELPAEHLAVAGIELGIYGVFILSIYYVFKQYILSRFRAKIASSRFNFGNYLIKHNMFTRTAALVPIAAFSMVGDKLSSELMQSVVEVCTYSLMVIFSATLVASFLNAVVDIAANKGFKKLPLKPIAQVLKIVLAIVAMILLYSKLIGESPKSIMAGLGALSAVTLLVFKDTLQSLVAAFMITFYNSVEVLDWIEIPELGVDGDVEEVNLNFITIKNFDNTRTIIPTHKLMSVTTKNYRKMTQEGRRIKRAITLDVNSARLLTKDDLADMMKVNVLKTYLQEREGFVLASDDNIEVVNNRQLSNLGTFRHYIIYYLKNHEEICQKNTLMVRQLSATGEGVPLEVYCFTHNTAWAHNESVMADIFDHLYTVASYFNLRIYQRPTGVDIAALGSSN